MGSVYAVHRSHARYVYGVHLSSATRGAKPALLGGRSGGPGHDEARRRGNLRRAPSSAMPKAFGELWLVEVTGFEPVTPSLRTRCSAELSYTPKAAESVAVPPNDLSLAVTLEVGPESILDDGRRQIGS
jgi:hypothetical protein